MIEIARSNSGFEREELAAPFGFKGKYITELWQTAALLESRNGFHGVGLGVQSILWSDAAVFSQYSEPAGNSAMFLLTEYALRKARGLSFSSPMELLDQLLPEVYEYGRKITGNKALRKTFALNALVPLDHAAWQLYCRENGIGSFDGMIPQDIRPALGFRHEMLAGIPLIPYGLAQEDIVRLVEEGSFFLKIKIGSDPERDGDPEKMVAWDKQRLSAIHQALKDIEIPYTENRRIPYYLDANGRYDSKARLNRLLEHANSIGALERIILLEEPFPEEYREDVSDIPVRLAADESAHSDQDVLERIEMGYRAVALKPIAKTLSMSFKIAKIAHERSIPCFCADLTVNPVMVDWNKNVAARLAPLPGMAIGVLETNGHQNYRNWDKIEQYHPRAGSSWTKVQNGLFRLDERFYACSGGILENSEHYSGLVKMF